MVCLPFPVIGGKHGIVLPSLISKISGWNCPTTEACYINSSPLRWANKSEVAISAPRSVSVRAGRGPLNPTTLRKLLMEYYNRNTLLINGINRRVFYALMEYYKCYDKCYEFLLLINGDFNIPSKSFCCPLNIGILWGCNWMEFYKSATWDDNSYGSSLIEFIASDICRGMMTANSA